MEKVWTEKWAYPPPLQITTRSVAQKDWLRQQGRSSPITPNLDLIQRKHAFPRPTRSLPVAIDFLHFVRQVQGAKHTYLLYSCRRQIVPHTGEGYALLCDNHVRTYVRTWWESPPPLSFLFRTSTRAQTFAKIGSMPILCIKMP